jgi:fibronectin type 3 domain-containing protein
MIQQVKRRVLLTVVMAMVVALAALGVPGTALAVGSVRLAGSVTDQSGAGVTNVAVTATAPGGSAVLFGPSLTAANGAYTLDVDPGTYDIRFVPSGGGLNPITSNSLNLLTDQTLNVQLTPPTHVLSGVLRDGSGVPVPSMQMVFRLVSTNTSVVATTDVNGRYSATVSGGVYYLAQVNGNAPATVGSINVINRLGAGGMPQYDVTNVDLVQDFVLPTTTLTVTVKDGFGNPVSNAPVSISSSPNSGFVLAGGVSTHYNANSRNGVTNGSGIVTLTVFATSYQPGLICAIVSGNQICNTTTVIVSGPANLLYQSAPQVPPAPTGLTGATPTANPPALTWNPVGVAASYRVYRNGQQVGSPTTNSFTDMTIAAGGTYNYTVTSISALNLESPASAAFSVVYTSGPAVTNVAVNPATVSVGRTASLIATVTDAVATVTTAEYFEGADPGEGLGIPMTVSGSTISATLPSTLSLGQHTFTVRAKDSLGAWTRGILPAATLTVTLPALTGRVLDGANQGLAGTRIDVVDPGNHATVIATTTSAGNGSYSVSVQPGTYDVIYTPTGSLYAPTVKTGVNLTTSTTVDVVLLLAPRTFSGTLRDENGAAVSGAMVTLHNQSQTYVTLTAADGSFTLDAHPAVYAVTFIGSKTAAPSAFIPSAFRLSGGAFDLTDDQSHDFTVPAATVTFVTKSGLTGNTVGNVGLGVSTSGDTTVYPGSGTYTGSGTYSATTNGDGVASVIVLAGSRYAVTAAPPAGSGVVTTSFPQAGPIIDDSTVELPLTADIRHFSGVFRDSTGTAIPGATVRLSGPLGTFSATTGASGSFDVEAAAGSYTMTVSGGRPAGSGLHIPDGFSFTGVAVDISSQDRTQDLILPAEAVVVTAKSPFDTTLPNVAIQVTAVPGIVELYPGGAFTANASSTATTNGDGTATLYVTRGLAYTTKATPFAGSGYLVTNLAAGAPITGSAAWTITLQRDLKTVAGAVTDADGAPVAGATVRLDGSEADQHYSTTTNASGAFTFQVAPNGSYALRVSGTKAASPAAYLPDNFTLTTTIAVTADVTRNIEVSAVRLDILARDDRLTSVPAVGVGFTSSGAQNGFTASSTTISRTTGADGRTEVVMLSGTTYTITATPPTGIGYLPTTFTGTSPITHDSTTVIEFQNHIPLAPTGLTAASPTKTAPVLSWNPAAGTDHYRVYRDDAQIGIATGTTFTDTTLTGDGAPQYRVSAVSANGFESPRSAAVTVVYDTTAPQVGTPQFTVNPKAVGRSTVVSATATDVGAGVAVGEYFLGMVDPGEGHGTAMTVGGGTLSAVIGTDLPAGVYLVNVRARDALGTWSSPIGVYLTVSDPAAPTGLHAPSPTNHDPALSWTASPDAVRYAIYRDGIRLTEDPIVTTYTDIGRDEGTYTYTVRAVNALGDLSDPSNPAVVTVDTTMPDITYVLTPAPNSVGWNSSDVTVTFQCDDGAGAGIAFCPSAVQIASDTAGQDVTGVAVDRAGNTKSVTARVKRDTVTPTIVALVSPSPDAAGWNNTAVIVTFTCTDTLSGVASCPPPSTVHDDGVTSVTATAIDQAGNTTSITVPVKVDQTPPVLGTPAWTTNPKPTNGSSVLTVPATDMLSGVSGGEYYLETDPGVGHGIPMPYSGGNLTATIGTGLAVGVHPVAVRGRDAAGNWTTIATTMLVVYDPAVTIGVTGKNKKDLIPSLANGDVLPGLTSPTQTDPVDYGFTVDYTGGTLDSGNDFMLTYNVGSKCNTPHAQNCHTLSASASSFNWMVIDQTNNSRGRFQGTATVVVDGVSTTNPVTVEGIDGDRLTPAADDRITVKIYAPGANPATASPTFQVSGALARGNSVRVR